VLVELLGTKTLLAVPGKDCLDRGISALYSLKCRQRCIYSILGQMIKDGAGSLTSRHDGNDNRVIGSVGEANSGVGRALAVRQPAEKMAGLGRS
jgi:hypothetical protein